MEKKRHSTSTFKKLVPFLLLLLFIFNFTFINKTTILYWQGELGRGLFLFCCCSLLSYLLSLNKVLPNIFQDLC